MRESPCTKYSLSTCAPLSPFFNTSRVCFATSADEVTARRMDWRKSDGRKQLRLVDTKARCVASTDFDPQK